MAGLSIRFGAGIKYILGLQIEKGVLKLKPCIPNDWKQYEIKYKYGDSIYNIKVINKNSKNTGIEKIYLNFFQYKSCRKLQLKHHNAQNI